MTDRSLDQRALALFEAALDRPAAAREAWVMQQAGADKALADRVLSLFAADRAASVAVHTGGAQASVDAPLPERIGAYRIVRRIGQGGMGAVYLGERASDDFRHQAAIKLVKPGVLSDALIQRFLAERQTLADLVHPNIARFHDGGATERGEPYIVMEYVDGRPITDWAADNSLGIPARLALFRQVCDAVRFAHQNLIVHRDITPSNVLVAADGAPRLIDFGIAKPPEAEGGDGAASSPYPSLAGLSLTPGFAAPERMAGVGATTLSDVFSLGRLLDVLVEDHAPDADLKAIIATATALDPADRYASVDALMDDLDRHATGRTVTARNGGRGYAIGKLVRRYRWPVTAAAVALALILAALIVALVSYCRAERARVAEEQRFEEVRALAGYMIFDLNSQLERIAGSTKARADLAEQAGRYLSALAASPGADDALKLEAARGFIALARAQGVPDRPHLGQIENARANLERAIGMIRDLREPSAPDLAEAQASLAMILGHIDSKTDAAAARLVEAHAVLAAVPSAARDRRWHMARRNVRKAELDMTTLTASLDDMPRLSDLLEAEIAEWPAAMRDSSDASLDRAYARYYRGIHHYFLDQPDDAVADLLEAERLFREAERANPGDPNILYALAWNANVGYSSATQSPALAGQARRFLDQASSILDRLLQIESNDDGLRAFAANVQQARSQALSADGRHSEAIALQRGVIAMHQDVLRRNPTPARSNRLVLAHVTMANIARAAGDRDTACAEYRSAREKLTVLDQRNEALGSVGRYGAGLDANLAACSWGGAANDLVILE